MSFIFLAMVAQAWAGVVAPVPAFRYGILLMAHGGGLEWNAQVENVREEVDKSVPAETAFGMADVKTLQAAADRLEKRGVKKIVVVPLFVNSHSSVLDQARYAFGILEKPSDNLRRAYETRSRDPMVGMAMPHGMKMNITFSTARVKTSLPLVMTPAMDRNLLIAEILVDRARLLSKKPDNETVVLVGHGPVDEEDNAAWLKDMRYLAAFVKRGGPFKSVLAATLRDDAPDSVRRTAARELRGQVQRAAENGGVVVVPFLVASDGIEGHIKTALQGFSFVWDGRGLCPHPNMARWVLESAAAFSEAEDMRKFSAVDTAKK